MQGHPRIVVPVREEVPTRFRSKARKIARIQSACRGSDRSALMSHTNPTLRFCQEWLTCHKSGRLNSVPSFRRSVRMVKQPESVVYSIDADDNIVSVNEAWTRFAIENDAAQLSTEVIGTSLWGHIVGVDVAHIYRDLLSRVRTKMVSASFPFRCDSPEHYRKMRLVVVPLLNKRVEFRAHLDSEGPHARTIELLRPRSAAEPKSFVTMCAWCKAIVIDGIWTPLERAIEQTSLFLQEPFPRFTHGICDACVKEYSKLAP